MIARNPTLWQRRTFAGRIPVLIRIWSLLGVFKARCFAPGFKMLQSTLPMTSQINYWYYREQQLCRAIDNGPKVFPTLKFHRKKGARSRARWLAEDCQPHLRDFDAQEWDTIVLPQVL
jgi:hypothetical protein